MHSSRYETYEEVVDSALPLEARAVEERATRNMKMTRGESSTSFSSKKKNKGSTSLQSLVVVPSFPPLPAPPS